MTAPFAFLDWPQTRTLVAAFERADTPLRFVGGCVRDALLGREVRDIDAATPALPERTIEILKHAGIQAIPTGMAHGTVTALVDGKPFEITTLRKDVATDGRHAQVQYVDDWKEDAARRDFTMNALYVSPQGELFDYFGGQKDAGDGVVQFIGDAKKRISEDYLRILRLFRFYAWYGKKKLDQATLDICHAEAKNIDALSGERIRREMFKLLSANDPFAALAHMQGNVMAHVFGKKVKTNQSQANHLAHLEQTIKFPPDPLLRLLLLIDDAKAMDHIIERWKFSNLDAKRLQLLFEHRFDLRVPKRDATMQKKLLRAIGSENFKALVMLQWVHEFNLAGIENSPFKAMLALAGDWKAPPFPVSGEDLLSCGIPAGKEMGELLKKLEAQWEESDYTLGKEALLATLKK